MIDFFGITYAEGEVVVEVTVGVAVFSVGESITRSPVGETSMRHSTAGHSSLIEITIF